MMKLLGKLDQCWMYLTHIYEKQCFVIRTKKS